jgi:hypothetical protein
MTTAYDGILPEEGMIPDLPAGSYTGTLRSEREAFTLVPAFDTPRYSATVEGIVIPPGATASVEFVCRQTNAGVRFLYDPSLAEAGYGDAVPVLALGSHDLEYSGGDKDNTGYFMPGTAVLTLTDGGVPLTLSGASSSSLRLSERELWTVTLTTAASQGTGGSGITASVDTETIGRELTVTVGPPADKPAPPVTPPADGKTLLRETFARCAGSAYPVAGAVFNSSAAYPALNTPERIAAAGLGGWELNNAYTCAGGLKMGKGGTGGTATTPPLSALGGATADVVVTLLAAGWEAAPIGLRVSVVGGGRVVSPAGGVLSLSAGTPNGKVVAPSSAMTRYAVAIDGATRDTRIVFAPAADKGNNRYFLADITVARSE